MRRLPMLALALLAAWLVACVFVFVRPRIDPVPGRADAVVVLSGSRRRLPPALALIRRGVAPVLALSSVSHEQKWAYVHELCRSGRYAGARVLCFEAKPYSTRGEAETVARIAAARGWTSIVVVTSTFHVSRARLLFRRCYHGALALRGAPTRWYELPLDWVSETAKLAVQLTVERSC
ncbi:MAG: YdcF family protein [Gaiellaceae bacterium]